MKKTTLVFNRDEDPTEKLAKAFVTIEEMLRELETDVNVKNKENIDREDIDDKENINEC